MPRISIKQAKAAKESALRRFEKLGSVTGVGITRVRGAYAVKLNVREAIGPGVKLPSAIDGVPLKVEVTGTIRAR